jgi:hypothetical protein
VLDEYIELRPGGLIDKERELRLLAMQQNYQHAASRHSAKQGGVIYRVRGFLTTFTQAAASGDLHLPTAMPISRDTRSKACTNQNQSGTHVHNFIHWCIPRSQYATRMFPLKACQINGDMDFFRALNKLYRDSSNRIQMLLSFKKPIALRFVKVSRLVFFFGPAYA